MPAVLGTTLGTDRFCLDGGLLISTSDPNSASYGQDGTEYRTEIESSIRVISRGGTGQIPDHFELHASDGRVLYFGLTESARLRRNTQATSTQSVPGNWFVQTGVTATTVSWHLEKVSDKWGNYYAVSYSKPDAADGALGTLYVSSISYTANDAAGVGPSTTVSFTYALLPGGRVYPKYMRGMRSVRDRTLSSIEILQAGGVVRTYEFLKEQYASGAPNLAAQYPRLASIRVCSAGACLPATRFSYTDALPEVGALAQAKYAPGPAETLSADNGASAGPRVFMNHRSMGVVDLDGDGESDLAVASERASDGDSMSVRLLMSNGTEISRDIPQGITGAPSVHAFDHASQFQLFDVDLDGNTDLVFLATDSGTLVSRSTSTGTAAYSQYNGWSSSPGVSLPGSEHHAYVADIDGDGYEDLIKVQFIPTGTGSDTMYWAVLLNKAKQLEGPNPKTRAQLDAEGWFELAVPHDAQGTALSNSYYSVNTGFGNVAGATSIEQYALFAFSDIDANGKPDFLSHSLAYDSASFFRNLSQPGYLAFNTQREQGSNYPSSFYSNCSGHNLPGFWRDLNGDGLVDFVKMKGSHICAFLGRGDDGTFSYSIDTSRALVSGVSTLLVDLNADGFEDIVYVKSSGTDGAWVGVSYGFGDGTFSALTDSDPVKGWLGKCEAPSAGGSEENPWCQSFRGCPRFCVNGPKAGNCPSTRRHHVQAQARRTRRTIGQPAGQLQEA